MKLKKQIYHYRGKVAVIFLLFFIVTSSILPTYLQPSASIVHAAGNGTKEDPYQISTVQDLKDISIKGLDKHYVLTNDIVFEAGSYWTPLGTSTSPFTGSLNGNGFKIKNLLVNINTEYAGLFTAIKEATIKYLTLET